MPRSESTPRISVTSSSSTSTGGSVGYVEQQCRVRGRARHHEARRSKWGRCRQRLEFSVDGLGFTRQSLLRGNVLVLAWIVCYFLSLTAVLDGCPPRGTNATIRHICSGQARYDKRTKVCATSSPWEYWVHVGLKDTMWMYGWNQTNINTAVKDCIIQMSSFVGIRAARCLANVVNVFAWVVVGTFQVTQKEALEREADAHIIILLHYLSAF